MTSVLEFLHLDQPDSLKRAMGGLFSFLGLLVINPILTKANMPPISDDTLIAGATVASAWLLQSGANSVAKKLSDAKAAGVTAADAIKTPADAAAALVPPPPSIPPVTP